MHFNRKYRTNFYFGIKCLLLSVLFSTCVSAGPVMIKRARSSFNVGPCTWVIERDCPDEDIKFYLYTRSNPTDRQLIQVNDTLEGTNLTTSYFNPVYPVKIILHGYNSDMFLTPLIDMKDEYLNRSNYNLFYVDWSVLAPGPCYPSAVHNTKHVGVCVAQLINRLLDSGTDNVHLIGFSLGAQVTNYVSQTLKPFKLKRITGLDPAMPLFVTVNNDDKLDPSDADFVDVIHTNALVQGKIERCGHVDFYMNGGILQPGCWGDGKNPVACSHHRAPDYFQESIRTFTGFWGWQCQSYVYYLLGFCPPSNLQVVAGEDCDPESNGMYLINTNPESPYAIGRWTNLGSSHKKNNLLKNNFGPSRDPLLHEIDKWGKLDSNFNNIEHFPTPYSQDPNGDEDWPYFNHIGTKSITKDYIKKILNQNKVESVVEKNRINDKFTVDNIDDKIKYLQDIRDRLQQKEMSMSANTYKLPVFSQH